jgi:hypothetical protein
VRLLVATGRPGEEKKSKVEEKMVKEPRENGRREKKRGR